MLMLMRLQPEARRALLNAGRDVHLSPPSRPPTNGITGVHWCCGRPWYGDTVVAGAGGQRSHAMFRECKAIPYISFISRIQLATQCATSCPLWWPMRQQAAIPAGKRHSLN